MKIFCNGKYLNKNGELTEGAILVEGAKIKKISPNDDFPEEVERINVGGKTIFPGLINAHSHISFFPGAIDFSDIEISFQAVNNAQKALKSGITTMRDVGGIRQIDIHLRDAINNNLFPGPELLVAGQFISISGGHSYVRALEADGLEEVRKAVRLQIKAGADLIKLMGSGGFADPKEDPTAVQFTFEELRIAAEEAHRFGKPVSVHAHPQEAIKVAVAAGADFIEHASFLDDEIIEILLKNNTVIVPTFCVYRHISQWEKMGDVIREKTAEVLKEKISRFKKALSAGVKFAVGTDNGTFFPHDDLVSEIKILVELGISPSQAIIAATKQNAKHLGLEHKIGTIEEGKQADLVVFGKDPFNDLDQLKNPVLVMKKGVLFN